MIDQYMLRYFLAVAELGNFGRAAQRVSVTQPTVSAGIAKLERLLGVRLFERDKQRVALTPAGSKFLLRARRMLAEYQLALQDFKAVPEPASGPKVLRIGVLTTIPTAMLESIIARHHLEGKGELLEMVEGSERDLAERLDRGRIDVALGVVRPHHARFRPEVLRAERYLMVLPPDHPLAGQEVVEAEQLAADRMVVRRHCEALPEISRFFTDRGVRPRFVLKTTNDHRVLAVVRARGGIGMMPAAFAEPEVDAGVRFVRVRDFDLQREVGLLYGAATDPSRHADSSFVRIVREVYGREA